MNSSKRDVIHRRNAIKIGASSLLAASFVNHIADTGCALGPLEDKIDSWKKRLGNVSEKLGRGQISGLQWQEEMDRIYDDTPITDLLKMIKFDDLKQSMLNRNLGGRGELFLDIAIPDVVEAAGRPEPSQVLISKLAYIEKGRNIPPHGHGNMVSAFLCVSGDFHVRLFDRIEDRKDEMIVRKSNDDSKAGVGTWSSISDYKDNVHWLTANSDNCFLFTCKLIKLEPDREFRGRINIDMREPKQIGSNTYRAKKIDFKRASEIY